jgi:hypothetical protein
MVLLSVSKSIAVTVIADGKSKYGMKILLTAVWLLVLSSGDTINYTLATTSQFSNGQYPIML